MKTEEKLAHIEADAVYNSQLKVKHNILPKDTQLSYEKGYIDGATAWSNKGSVTNNTEPKPYSDLACPEGLEFLEKLFGYRYVFENGNFRCFAYADSFDIYGTVSGKEPKPNWQLILSNSHIFKGELVYFLPDGFNEN